MEPALSYYENRMRYHISEYYAFHRESTRLQELQEDTMTPLHLQFMFMIVVSVFFLLAGVAITDVYLISR
jgi:hypothetical protein